MSTKISVNSVIKHFNYWFPDLLEQTKPFVSFVARALVFSANVFLLASFNRVHFIISVDLQEI